VEWAKIKTELAGHQQRRCPQDDDVVDPAKLEGGVDGECCEGSARSRLADDLEPRLTESGHRARHHHPSDVEGANQARDGLSEVRRRFEDDGADLRVAPFEIGDRLVHRYRMSAQRGQLVRTARALARVSRQPRRPQRQTSPFASMTVWPISPAPNRSPPKSSPFRTMPAPMPWPTLTTIRLAPRVSAKTCSASAAAWLSLAT